MPYRIQLESFFEAAHALRLYKGKPEPLHGHSWKVEVTVDRTDLGSEGMAVDFVGLRKALEGITRRLDYTCINEVAPFDDLSPSAENLARWIYEELHPSVVSMGGTLSEVRVWEGPNGSATYFR